MHNCGCDVLGAGNIFKILLKLEVVFIEGRFLHSRLPWHGIIKNSVLALLQ